jgi:hypothetical protein
MTTQPGGQAEGVPVAAGDAAGQLALTMTYGEMDSALEDGSAVVLGQAIAWLAKCGNCWWVLYERGWLRVLDHDVATELDGISASLARADRGARDAVLRATLRPEFLGTPGRTRTTD